jgi:hypothetical protein
VNHETSEVRSLFGERCEHDWSHSMSSLPGRRFKLEDPVIVNHRSRGAACGDVEIGDGSFEAGKTKKRQQIECYQPS